MTDLLQEYDLQLGGDGTPSVVNPGGTWKYVLNTATDPDITINGTVYSPSLMGTVLPANPVVDFDTSLGTYTYIFLYEEEVCPGTFVNTQVTFVIENCVIVCGSFYAHSFAGSATSLGLTKFNVNAAGEVESEELICPGVGNWLDMAIRSDGTVYYNTQFNTNLFQFFPDTCTNSSVPITDLGTSSNGLSFVDDDTLLYESTETDETQFSIGSYNIATDTLSTWATTTIESPRWKVSGDFFIFNGRVFGLLSDSIERRVALWDFGVYGATWDGTQTNIGYMPGFGEYLGGAGANGYAFAVNGADVYRINMTDPGASPLIHSTTLIPGARFLGAASIQDTGAPC